MITGPLAGVRILDLTHVWAGPLATRILADLGAQVVKIEAHDSRGPQVFPGAPIGGWIGGEPAGEPWNRNALFSKLARNKQSVAINLKHDQGREVFLQLVAQADVVIENFSARAMPSLGLDYAALAAANPKIIYVSMPGFGMSGVYRDRVAFGPTVEALAGFDSVLGYSESQPRNTAMALMDPTSGVAATVAVTRALRERRQSGHGALLEFSLHEGGVNLIGPWLIDTQLGVEVKPIGNRHPQMAPHGVYRCAGDDQWIALACRDNADWRALCAVMQLAFAADLTVSERSQQHDAIDRAIAAWTGSQDKHVAANTLQAAHIPAGPVNTTPDMTADEQIRSRGFFVELEDPPTPMPGNPINMPGLSSAHWHGCRPLGADNTAVLRGWLGYSDEQIAALEADQVLADKPPA